MATTGPTWDEQTNGMLAAGITGPIHKPTGRDTRGCGICIERLPHALHGECLGLAPEFPTDRHAPACTCGHCPIVTTI